MSNLVSTKQLKAARALAGLTQDQLGAEMGLNGRMVRFWERRIPTNPRKVARIEQALLANGVALFTEPTAGARFV
jgi:transcriptional regulator with XRE-family HTH domain